MTTIDTRPDVGDTAIDGRSRDVDSPGVAAVSGVGAWITTTDHKRIGRIYVGFGLVALVAAAVLGALLGLERADSGTALLDGNALLQLFQSYRVALAFGVAAPLGLGLAIAITPLQLGARAIAFPRLALTGCYAWLGGLSLTIAALAANGGMGGADEQGVELFLAGLGLMIVGLLASAGCVATSVLTTRAPGMTMRRVPLFAWSSLIGALGMLLALPVAFGALIYLFLDVHYAQLNFGGSEGIVNWIGWVFSVPLVVVFALPAVGVAADTVPVAFRARQAMRGVTYAAISLIGVTALAATTQQDVFAVSLDADQATADFVADLVPFLIFAGLPLLGLVMVMGLGALTAKNGVQHGRPRIGAGFVFSFFGLAMIGAGLAGNFLLGISDLELLGTTFEEGATVYVVYGSVLGVMGGLVFWSPKLWGRSFSGAKAMPLALLGLLATVLAGLPYYIAGFADQAGGVPGSAADVAAMLSLDYGGPGELWNVLVLIGHALMALTVVGFAGLMIATFTGEHDDDDDNEINPVGGQTLEWSTPSPAPAHNFEHVPTVTSAEPLFADEGSSS